MDIQVSHTAKAIDQLLMDLGDFKSSFEENKHAHSKALHGVENVISTFSGNEQLVFEKLNELISVVILMRSEQKVDKEMMMHTISDNASKFQVFESKLTQGSTSTEQHYKKLEDLVKPPFNLFRASMLGWRLI